MESEKLSFVIRLPKIQFKALLKPQVFLFAAAALVFFFMGYWYIAIRPILWIPQARVEAFSLNVSSDTESRILSMNGNEGDTVEKGKPLFVLTHESAKEKQKQLQAKMKTLQEQIQIEKLRMEQSMHQYLSASNQLDFSIGSSENIEKNLQILEEAQLKSEKASAELSSLELESFCLNVQMQKMSPQAPFDAIIFKKWKNEGEMLSSGETVYTLLDPKQTWIAADISEVYLSKLFVGMPVKIRLSAYPKREWSGKIERICPAASVAEGQKTFVRFHASIECTDLFLRPGLSASVALKVL